VINVRLHGGAPTFDVRVRSAPAKLPHWISAVLLLIAAAAVAVGLLLAAFGLFAALRIAHAYGPLIERPSAATSFAQSGWQRKPSDSDDRVISVLISPPVVASSEPTENASSLESEIARGEPRPGNADPDRMAANPEPMVVAAAPLEGPVSGAAAETESTGSIDPAAVAAPRSEKAAAPHAKRHHAVVKHRVVRKRVVRRIVRRPAYSSANSPFQPMFSSP